MGQVLNKKDRKSSRFGLGYLGTIVVVLAILLPSFTFSSSAQVEGGYVGIGVGYGGVYDKLSINAEIGRIDKVNKEVGSGFWRIWGIGMSAIPIANAPRHLDYPCPHLDIVKEGEFFDGPEYEFYFKLGGGAGESPILFIGGIGLAFSSEVTLYRSRVTGWLYEHERVTSRFTTFMGELRFIDDRWGSGVGYHSRRGPFLNISGRF